MMDVDPKDPVWYWVGGFYTLAAIAIPFLAQALPLTGWALLPLWLGEAALVVLAINAFTGWFFWLD